MTEAERIAFGILQSLNIAILRRMEPDRYEFFGFAPPFYDALFPPVDGKPCSAPWEISSMLEFFLMDAEEMFELGTGSGVDSGIWVEEGLPEENTALRATAKWLNGVPVIQIRLLKEEYAEKVTTLRKAREQLLVNRQLSYSLDIFREKSCIDGLTGILNKATFMELLADEIKRSIFLNYPLFLLILDIDDFKQINDTYGHLVGDKVLREIGASLKHMLRRSDITGRYGGEEFVALLPHAIAEEARRVAEKVRKSMAELVVPDAPRFTVSIGCTGYALDESLEDFFQRADTALYVAKKSGKNRACFA